MYIDATWNTWKGGVVYYCLNFSKKFTVGVYKLNYLSD